MKKGIVSILSNNKEQVLKGIELASEPIALTMGPSGYAVLMQHIQMVDKERQPTGKVRSVKDGVTIAKHLAFDDPEMDYGRALVVEACLSTLDKAGDGTTSTAVLTKEICSNLPDGNPHLIKHGIRSAVRDVLEKLKSCAKQIDENSEELKQVANISANGDAVGLKVAELVKKVGRYGHIRVKVSGGPETEIEHMDGLNLDWGLSSPYFKNTPKALEIDKAYVLIADYELTDFERQLGAKGKKPGPIGYWLQNLKGESNIPLVIFCRNIKDSAMKYLVNFKQQGLPIHVISMPGHTWGKAELMDDLALVTGAKVYSVSKGKSMKDVYDATGYGKCEGLYATMEKVVVGHSVDISKRVSEINERLGSAEGLEKDQLLDRLAKLTGGVGTIAIGGATEAEIEREKDTADDVKRSCFSAIEHGVVPGCGNALAWASKKVMDELEENGKEMNEDFKKGYVCLLQSCFAPMRRIFLNAHKKPSFDYPISPSVSEDLFTGANINLWEKGIIDSYLAISEALLNSSSVAVQFLESDTILYYDIISA